MDNFTQDQYEININQDRDKVIMLWLGKIREKEPVKSPLHLYLDNLVESLKGNEVIIDLTKVMLMNSTSILCLILLLNNLDDNGVKTMVLYDSNLAWQNVSFRVIVQLSEKLAHISMESI